MELYLGIGPQAVGPAGLAAGIFSLGKHGSLFDESLRVVLSAPVQLIRLPGPIPP